MKRSTSTRRSRALAAALAGVVAVATFCGASASASAAPAVAPMSLASGLYLTSNSVMAGASVPYNGNPATVTVYWGDGTLSGGSSGIPASGALLFRHEYAPSASGAAFYMLVTTVSGAETVPRYLLVTPRYLVEKGLDYFSPLNHCDSFVETDTEWHVDQDLYRGDPETQPISSKDWDFERATGPNVIQNLPVFEPLADSGFSFEMTMADPSIYVWHHAQEIDLILDDHLNGGAYQVHPSFGSQFIDRQLSEFSGDCKAEIIADLTVTLLKPYTAIESLPLPPAPPADPRPPRCNGNPRNCQEQ
jgi:hypothetical protein